MEEQQVRLRAARAAAEAMSVPLVINARIDTFLMEVGDAATRLDATVQRAAAYRAARADCIFVPGVRDLETIAALAERTDGPLNVLAGHGSPPLPELTKAGVARVSFGPWPALALLGQLQRIAQGVLTNGTYGPFEGSLSFAQGQVLIAAAPTAAAIRTASPAGEGSAPAPAAT
ncbi:MAG: isocitrate lyase/phosphoenolpyruvate mutase family protein [Acidimicrobiales bacterium]